MAKRVKQFFLIGLVVISFNLLAKEQSEPKITFSKINENFWVLHGGNGLGANAGVSIGDDGILLVDAMNIKTGKMLIDAIRTISDKPIKYVINTHQHADHRGGNEELVKIGATVIYPNYLKYLSSSNTQYDGVTREIQFQDKMTLKFNNEIFNLFHVKSHTWNDVIVQAKNNNIVFTGDNHGTSWGPNIGVRGKRSISDVFDLVLALSDSKTLVVPGHTTLTDRKHVVEYVNKLEEWTKHILTLSAKGLSVKQIAETAEINRLIAWFHGGKRPEWLTEERLLARIEWTVLIDEKSPLNLTPSQLALYTGFYQLDDGSQVEIFSHQKELYAFKDKTFTSLLLSRSKSHFDFAGWSEKEKISFEFNSDGKVSKLLFSVNDKVEFTANRINK